MAIQDHIQVARRSRATWVCVLAGIATVLLASVGIHYLQDDAAREDRIQAYAESVADWTGKERRLLQQIEHLRVEVAMPTKKGVLAGDMQASTATDSLKSPQFGLPKYTPLKFTFVENKVVQFINSKPAKIKCSWSVKGVPSSRSRFSLDVPMMRQIELPCPHGVSRKEGSCVQYEIATAINLQLHRHKTSWKMLAKGFSPTEDWNPVVYKRIKVPDNKGPWKVPLDNFRVEIRSSADPWLKAQSLTDGQMSFGLPHALRMGTAHLYFVGAISTFIAMCTLILCGVMQWGYFAADEEGWPLYEEAEVEIKGGILKLKPDGKPTDAFRKHLFQGRSYTCLDENDEEGNATGAGGGAPPSGDAKPQGEKEG